MKISIIIERDDEGYYAYAPELPGCHSQGDSREVIEFTGVETNDL